MTEKYTIEESETIGQSLAFCLAQLEMLKQQIPDIEEKICMIINDFDDLVAQQETIGVMFDPHCGINKAEDSKLRLKMLMLFRDMINVREEQKRNSEEQKRDQVTSDFFKNFFG